MKNYILIITVLFSSLLASCAKESKKAPATTSSLKDIQIVLSTNKGDIEATLYASKTPITVANFLNLAKRGYYNNLIFHRVIANFMIQGGDPTGTGRGGPGYHFFDETRKDLTHNSAGILSMANSDRPGSKAPYSNTGNSNGSQFFITHGPTAHLNGFHTVFGKVTKGINVVNAVRKGDTIKSIKILDSTDALFSAQKANIQKWNAVLDAKK